MQQLTASIRIGLAKVLAALLFMPVRTAAVLAVFLSLATQHTTAQAVRIVRPRPQYFGFVSLTVTASPTTDAFTLVHGGVAVGASTIAITTAYTFGVAYNGDLALYGYFASAPHALSGGSPVSYIPSSQILGKVPTGLPTSYTAFTQTTPYGGASGLMLFDQTSIASFSGSRSDNLTLEINLTSTPQQPAATYTGTLTLEAQSM